MAVAVLVAVAVFWGTAGAHPTMDSAPVLLYPQRLSGLDELRFEVPPDDPDFSPNAPYRLRADCNSYTKTHLTFEPISSFCSGLPLVGTIENLQGSLREFGVRQTGPPDLDFSQLGIQFTLTEEESQIPVAFHTLRFQKMDHFIIFEARWTHSIDNLEDLVFWSLGRLDPRLKSEFGDWRFSVEFLDSRRLPEGLRFDLQRETLTLIGKLAQGNQTESQELRFRLRDQATGLVSEEFVLILGQPVFGGHLATPLVVGAGLLLLSVVVWAVFRRGYPQGSHKKGHVPIGTPPKINNRIWDFFRNIPKIFGRNPSLPGGSRIPNSDTSISSLRQIGSDFEVSTILESGSRPESFGDEAPPKPRHSAPSH